MYNVERNYPYGSPSQRSLACRSRNRIRETQQKHESKGKKNTKTKEE
jgi:hypothetical protein